MRVGELGVSKSYSVDNNLLSFIHFVFVWECWGFYKFVPRICCFRGVYQFIV